MVLIRECRVVQIRECRLVQIREYRVAQIRVCRMVQFSECSAGYIYFSNLKISPIGRAISCKFAI
jgi:hypothetical protein